jgi:hypothetical protein
MSEVIRSLHDSSSEKLAWVSDDDYEVKENIIFFPKSELAEESFKPLDRAMLQNPTDISHDLLKL